MVRSPLLYRYFCFVIWDGVGFFTALFFFFTLGCLSWRGKKTWIVFDLFTETLKWDVWVPLRIHSGFPKQEKGHGMHSIALHGGFCSLFSSSFSSLSPFFSFICSVFKHRLAGDRQDQGTCCFVLLFSSFFAPEGQKLAFFKFCVFLGEGTFVLALTSDI